MKRFTMTTAAVALIAAPALAADEPEEQIDTPSSELYQGSQLSPDADFYGVATLMGSDVYTTNRGVAVMNVDNLSADEVALVGSVDDVLVNNDGMMRGILVDPASADVDGKWFFTASEVMTVSDVEGPRFMISYTSDELEELPVNNKEVGTN